MHGTWATGCWRARRAPWLSQAVAGDSCGRTGIGRSGGDSRRSCGCTWLQLRCDFACFADWSEVRGPSKRKDNVRGNTVIEIKVEIEIGIELKVGIEIEIETELEIVIEIDIDI